MEIHGERVKTGVPYVSMLCHLLSRSEEIRLECAKDEQSEVQPDAEGHWHVYRY